MPSIKTYALYISACLLSLQSIGQPVLATTDPLGAYPGNTAAFSTSVLQPQHLARAFQNVPQAQRQALQEQFQDLILTLQKEGKEDLLKALSQVSGHLSVAYRSTPNGWGETLFQIETRDADTLTTALKSIDDQGLAQETFGGHTLYHWTPDTQTFQEFKGLSLHLAQQGKMIRGSIGSDDRGLKEMLYLDQVHAPQSPWRLSGQNDVQRAKQILAPHGEQWSYVRTAQLLPLFETFLQHEAPEYLPLDPENAWLKDALHYMEGVGLSLEATPPTQIHLNTVTQHQVTTLTPTQTQAIKLDQADQDYPFENLLGHFPAPLTAFLAGHFHRFGAEDGLPSAHKPPTLWKEMQAKAQEQSWQTELLTLLKLDYATDLAPHLAGPFALGWMPSQPEGAELNNHVGFVFDLKPEHNILGLLTERWKASRLNAPNGPGLYEVDLSAYSDAFDDIEALFPGLTVSESGPMALYFSVLPAEGSRPARLLLSNHHTALKRMLGARGISHPYFKTQALSQHHLYVNVPQWMANANLDSANATEAVLLESLQTHLKSVYMTQTHYPAYALNQTEVTTAPGASPWLSVAESLPLPVALMGAIALPNFGAAQRRAQQSSVKANMHVFQTLIETYAVDSEGVYPPDLESLEAKARANAYWRELVNPYQEGPLFMTWEAYHAAQEKPAGVVVYERRGGSDKGYLSYRLYGTDNTGQLLTDRGSERLFMLSND